MNYKLFIKIIGIIVCVASVGLEVYLTWMLLKLNFAFIPGFIVGMITFVGGILITLIPRRIIDEEVIKKTEQVESVHLKCS